LRANKIYKHRMSERRLKGFQPWNTLESSLIIFHYRWKDRTLYSK
jgi:hypothetical protein